MPTRFERRRFESCYDREDIRSYSNIELVKCEIYGGGFGWRNIKDFNRRTTAENIFISNCEVRKFPIGPGLFRDIVIENLAPLRGFGTSWRNFGCASSCSVKKVMSRLDPIVL